MIDIDDYLDYASHKKLIEEVIRRITNNDMFKEELNKQITDHIREDMIETKEKLPPRHLWLYDIINNKPVPKS